MLTRKMKDSGIEWIGEIPEDWEKVKFKYIFDYQKGKKPNLYNEPKEDLYPYVSMDVQRNNLNKYQYANSRDGVLGEKNDICVLWDGANAGEFYRLRIKGVISSTSAIILRNTINPIVDKDYLFYFLKFYEIELKSSSIGMGIPHVDSFKMKNDVISFPSLKKQNIIVTALNSKTKKIGVLITETQQSIEELKKYKQSLITEAVTKGLDPNVEMKDSGIEWVGETPKHWLITRPNRITTIVRGNSGFQKVDMKNTGDYVAVQYGQVYKLNVLDEKYQLYVDGKFYKEDQVVQKGDTILVSTSETMEDLGHSCFYNRKDIGLLGGEQLCLKPNKKVLFDKFLYYATTYFNLELNQYSTGLKVYRFKLDDLKKINMIVPSTIEEQRQIVSYLDEQTSHIDKLIEDKTKVIKELEDYKKSLIYEYVTGKKEV
ncbi:restriction endonuclease subunit S [Vagococcus jeotgali]|uniref:restriction endonuclease subunit S n=1 Tax=Vagococcus jeotgali TaxID=3109030 RepID=UPI002DD7BB76|nr:restriction endonuclease subunit S [Vagococcus sp. B2T-5]